MGAHASGAWLRGLVLVGPLLLAQAAPAQTVGEVEFARGTVSLAPDQVLGRMLEGLGVRADEVMNVMRIRTSVSPRCA